jgi:hypothetical protein
MGHAMGLQAPGVDGAGSGGVFLDENQLQLPHPRCAGVRVACMSSLLVYGIEFVNSSNVDGFCTCARGRGRRRACTGVRARWGKGARRAGSTPWRRKALHATIIYATVLPSTRRSPESSPARPQLQSTRERRTCAIPRTADLPGYPRHNVRWAARAPQRAASGEDAATQLTFQRLVTG